MYGGEWLTVPGYGSAPEQIDLDQVLNGAGRLSGTLTSSAGGPATEVKVRVHSNLDDGSPAAGRNYLTTTAEDGTWSVGGLPAGAYSVFFADGSDHYAPYAYDAGGSMAVAAYQSRTGIDATLQVGGRISGMITGDAGSGPGPVTGATVHAYLPAGGEVASAETGAAGFYQLALAPGTYRLYVTPPTGAEYAPEWYGAGATSQETAADLVVTLGSDATADAQLAFTGGPVTPVATTLATTSNSAWIAAGKSATLTGVLEDDTGQGVAGAELTLQARQGVSGAFHDAGSATTSSTGEASLSVSPTVTTTYRWVYAGDSGHLATTGTSTVVEVAFALTAKATKRTVKHTTTATVWGKVKPARKGTTVVLQRLVKGAWLTTTTTTTVKLQRLPGATHKTLGYLLKVKKPVGTYTFRVVAPATGTNVLGASGRLRITFT